MHWAVSDRGFIPLSHLLTEVWSQPIGVLSACSSETRRTARAKALCEV